MITAPLPESALTPGKASFHHSEKQERCGGDEDQHTSHIPKHLWLSPPANFTWNLKLPKATLSGRRR